MTHIRSARIGMVLSATDEEALKLATLHLRELLGEGFALVDGPICEAGLFELNCLLSMPSRPVRASLRIVVSNEHR